MQSSRDTPGFQLPKVVNPAGRRCIQIMVPDDPAYIAAFWGVLYDLTIWNSWQRDEAHTGIQAAKLWKQIWEELVFGNCGGAGSEAGSAGVDTDLMIRQDPANPCLLQSSIDGVNWCTFADISKCLPPPSQPGPQSVQPPAGGGQACYDGNFQANGQFLIPTPVQSGDHINVEVTGASTDGFGAPWKCPDGLTFFLGACSGVPTFDPADPLPTTPHMAIIINLGGTFHPLVLGSDFVVPSGVSGVQPTLQVNDSNLADDSGNLTVHVCVTNNGGTTFTHHFDFRSSTGAWQQNLFGGNSNAVWTPGSGYSSSIIHSTPVSGEGSIDLHLNCPRTLAHVTLRIVGTCTDGSVDGQALYQNTVAFPPQAIGEVYGQNNSGAIDFAHAFAANLDSIAGQVNAGATLGDTCTVTDIYVTADGTDPF